jgi:UDP-N-acetyl-2-amino-2-deoxyglucuronate dehydrogenase
MRMQTRRQRPPDTFGAVKTPTRFPPLDVAVIGCGAVVERLYRPALAKLESHRIVRVAALVDPNTARTAALARQFRYARTFSRPADAFASTAPTLTIVTSPAAMHVEHALAALAAGSHVLCEKPMAVEVDDAARMVAAARAARRVLAVGMTRRFYPCLVDAQRLITSGAIGEPYRFAYREGRIYDWPTTTDAAFQRLSGGGGVLIDLGSHVLDFLLALFGPLGVTGYADDGQADGVEANCRIELTGQRASGMAQLSWNQPLLSGLHVVGSRGELMVDPSNIDLIRWRREGETLEPVTSEVTWPADLAPAGKRGRPSRHEQCIYYEIVQVLRAALHNEAVPASGEDGLAVVRMVAACFGQARSLHLPWLEPSEQTRMDARHWKGDRWVAA